MKALLIIAHGSRRAASNDEIRALAAKIRAGNDGPGRPGESGEPGFDLVGHAFLEMAEPTIAQAAGELAAAGATEIVVLPYFLAAGNHIIADLPAAIAGLKTRHPAVKFTLTSHLGAAANMPRLIREHLAGW